MSTHAISLAGLVWFFGVLASGAATSLEDIGRQVVAKNPELVAARFMIDEAKGRHLGAGRLMNPEIEVTGRHMTEGREGGFSVGCDAKVPSHRAPATGEGGDGSADRCGGGGGG